MFIRIAITTKGKYTAINALSIQPLTDLVDDINSEVRLNAIKVGILEYLTSLNKV